MHYTGRVPTVIAVKVFSSVPFQIPNWPITRTSLERQQQQHWWEPTHPKRFFSDIFSTIVSFNQVTIMNGLTVNLHLLMLAFYKPEGMRRKILIEDHAFPSDRYAVRSLLRVKGVRVIFSRGEYHIKP